MFANADLMDDVLGRLCGSTCIFDSDLGEAIENISAALAECNKKNNLGVLVFFFLGWLGGGGRSSKKKNEKEKKNKFHLTPNGSSQQNTKISIKIFPSPSLCGFAVA